MDELMEILMEINPDIDYDNETKLIDDRMLDSLSMLMLITEICERFDIEIGPKWMKSENFNSPSSIWAMIKNIQQEKSKL